MLARETADEAKCHTSHDAHAGNRVSERIRRNWPTDRVVLIALRVLSADRLRNFSCQLSRTSSLHKDKPDDSGKVAASIVPQVVRTDTWN